MGRLFPAAALISIRIITSRHLPVGRVTVSFRIFRSFLALCLNPFHVRKMRFWIWIVLVCSQIGVGSGQEFLRPDESFRLGGFLPQTLARLENRETIHVTIIGAPLAASESMPALQLLNRLARRFYYTGGVRPLVGLEFPLFVEPGISYEDKTTPEATPFHLLQRLSTDALLNKPDLLVIQCGANECSPESVHAIWGRVWKLLPNTLDVLVIGPVPSSSRSLLEQITELRQQERAIRIQCHDRKALIVSTVNQLLPDKVAFADAGDSGHVASQIEAKWRDMRIADRLTEGAAHRVSEAVWETLLQAPVSPDYSVDARLSDGDLLISVDSDKTDESRIVFVGLSDPGTPKGVWRGQRSEGKSHTCRFSGSLLNSAVGFDGVATLVLADQRQVRLFDVPVLGLEERPPLPGFFHPAASASPVFAFPNSPASMNIEFLNMRGLTGSASGMEARFTKPRSSTVFGTGTGTMLVSWGPAGRVSRSYHLVAVPHLGLNQTIPMRSVEGDDSADETGVKFVAEADKNRLLIHCDLRGFKLAENDGATLRLDMAIDAREADRRLTGGYVGRIQVRAGTKDGAAEISPVEMALFGEGYSRLPTSTGMRAYLATRPNGDRRLTLLCDRRIFYRHEWIGGEKSQLGLRASLRVRSERGDSHWRLFECPRHPHDASGLAVLNLKSDPGSAWTVIGTMETGR